MLSTHETEATPTPFTVVLNWAARLKNEAAVFTSKLTIDGHPKPANGGRPD
jgi:hypothetical protein